MCAVSPMVHTSNIFSFLVAVNNSIKVGPLAFLLQMFIIMENIMKRPVFQTEQSWKQYFPPKRWNSFTKPQGITSQTIGIFIALVLLSERNMISIFLLGYSTTFRSGYKNKRRQNPRTYINNPPIKLRIQ